VKASRAATLSGFDRGGEALGSARTGVERTFFSVTSGERKSKGRSQNENNRSALQNLHKRVARLYSYIFAAFTTPSRMPFAKSSSDCPTGAFTKTKHPLDARTTVFAAG
jgi:hypothetical protein